MLLSRCFGLLVMLALIAGCATRPPAPQDINHQRHQSALAALTSWQLRGRLAFRSRDEKFSANLNWTQDQADFAVTLTNFIGITLMEMHRDEGKVELVADDKSYQDTDASRLLWQVTGWNIPAGQLPTWVKGQVSETDRYQFDTSGLVQSLSPSCLDCNAWQITYADYQQVEAAWLPHTIELRNRFDPDNLIKIRISEWTLN